jgi:hypothetical protein
LFENEILSKLDYKEQLWIMEIWDTMPKCLGRRWERQVLVKERGSDVVPQISLRSGLL